jgi:WD40 repeat protein
VRVWSADGSGAPLVLTGHAEPVLSASFSPDGQRIVSASEDTTVRIWSADGSGAPVVFTGHPEAVYFAAFSPDGRRVVSASKDRTVRVWNADGTGDPLVLAGHDDIVDSAVFAADGARIVSASYDHTVRVWKNLQPVVPGDPVLWTATAYCIPVADRQRMLGVSPEQAGAQDEQCRRRVEAAFPRADAAAVSYPGRP